MKFLAIFIIIIVAVVVLGILGWSRVPDMLANNLSKKLGVPVSIESMDIAPSRIDVNQLEIGNARGYSLPKAFSSKEIEFKAPLTEYFRDSITVDEIEVDDIYLGLEFDTITGAEGNWTKILRTYQKNATVQDSGKNTKILIKKLILNNIQTDLLFKAGDGKIQRLPKIDQIVLTNISTEGGFPTDQLMSTILGQMIKEVFIRQNMSGKLKGLLDTPGKAVDKALQPFKGLFNAVPREEIQHKKTA